MSQVSVLLEQAISRFGSEAATARAAGVSQPVVHEARKKGRVGPRLAIGLDKATDGEISKSILRPDLWPADEKEAAQ
jgi:DNA-binding transcriptional regulator YdaS (Cro superfamily)